MSNLEQTSKFPKSTRHANHDVSFKPLHNGMGFHPFEDGLPYTPAQKKTTLSPRGTGALAAGPARYHPPRTNVNPPTLQPTVESAPLEIQTFDFHYLVCRVLAYILDSALNLILCSLGMGFVIWKANPSPQTLITGITLLFTLLFLLFFNWAIITAQEVALGTTAGKKLFRLELGGSAWDRFLRSILFIPSSLFCGLGLVWALFRNDKQCWHDLAAGLQPENECDNPKN